MKKFSVLWVRGPSGHVLHRERSYKKPGGRTLCGIHVGKFWFHPDTQNGRKCKRCAA